MPLPQDLTPLQVKKAVQIIEKQASEWVELYFEQANLFSGIISLLGARALHAVSPYKKHKHPDIAQQRFPDLSLNGMLNPPPKFAVESKGSSRRWALQSHYDHSGWYIVWRYLVDPTLSFKADSPVVIWRVDVVFLQKSDWKYEGSTAGAGGGGRTHTFGLKEPAKKLKDCAAYILPHVGHKHGKPVLIEPPHEN